MFAKSRVDFLPFTALKELIQDLKERASKTHKKDNHRSAEASYQLSIAHFEGNCVAKSYSQSLEYLEKAAVGEYSRAISGCRNIFEVCGGVMSPQLQNIINQKLPAVAETELHQSFADTLGNTIRNADFFLATRQWADEDPSAYNKYITSPIFHFRTSASISIFNIVSSQRTGEHASNEPFDFKLLEGRDYESNASINFNKAKFIHSVRQHRCVEKTDAGGLTLLQQASAEGNLTMVITLITDLGARVDGVGNTPGFTPLWISCCTGNIDVASYLASQGADIRHKDGLRSRSILHFLNKCKNEDHLMKLFTMALRAGISLEERDSEGNTPLLSTFIGWDFTRGLAARYLILLKANVLAKAKAEYTAVSFAVRSLNAELVQDLCQAFDQSLLKTASMLQVPDISPEDAKCLGLIELAGHTEFYNKKVQGRFASSRLGKIVDILLDCGSLQAFTTHESGRGTNPLIGSCFLAHEDLTIAVLNSRHCPGIDDTDQGGMTALHWAVERGKVQITMELLRRGADPFVRSGMDYNAFKIAAIHSPRLLVNMLDSMDSGQVPRPADFSIDNILRTTSDNGASIFALLIIEGSPEHLEVAESLRVKYDMSYDDLSVSFESEASTSDTKMTLTAFLLDAAHVKNAFTLRQFEYLFSLDPRPRFVSDTEGRTLLHHAVDSWHHGTEMPNIRYSHRFANLNLLQDDLRSNPTGFAALKLLLAIFSDPEHLEATDKRGFTPLHLAAYNSNFTAIQIIYDNAMKDGHKVNLNLMDKNGLTPLSVVGLIQRRYEFNAERHGKLISSLQIRTAKTYEYLRNRGAYLASEQVGIAIR